MSYLLSDLLKLSVAERLVIIEKLILSVQFNQSNEILPQDITNTVLHFSE